MARHLDEDVQHWRKAQDWLYSTGKLSRPFRELLDFAWSLVDGIILCEVANFLHPGAIKSFNYRPSIQFMCVKNIDNFLNACIKFFGFQTHELFTATELLEVENFEKVVEVLSKLSQTSQAKAAGLLPFKCSFDNQELYHTLQRDAESRSEDIYSRIEDIFPLSDRTLDYSYQDSYQQESIYEDIVKIKQYRMDKPNDKRGYMIDELFETEKNYVQVLEIVITHFLDKLKITLKNEDVKIIFQNIEELKRIHEKLLQRLKLSIDNGGLNIGDCFLKTMEQFYKYGNYCACLDTAAQKIDELMSDSKMANLINRCSQESEQRFSLKDLLKVPAQRILKYHMLLENLHKVSPENSSLQEGFRIMKALASFINEYKRNFEQKLATKSIEERIQNRDEYVDLYAYGTLLKDGEVMLKTNNKPVKRFAFLFERCVLICKKSDTSNLEIQVSLDFESYEIADQFDPPGGSKFSFGWSMKNRVDILQPPYQILVKTSDQCKVWLSKLHEGYNLLRSPAHLQYEHRFCLNDFTKNTKCDGCQEVLSGVFVQGLLCQSCNLACHRHCKARISDCKKSKMMSRGSSYTNKDLPSLPSTSSFSSTGYNIPDVPDFHSTHTDGPPPTPNATSPPPIPPRVPSLKIDSETADCQAEETYENMATGGSPGAVPKPAKNFYSLDPLEKKKYLEKQNDLDGHGRRSIPSTPTSNSRSPSFDRGSPQQFVTIQADLFVCTKDYNGAPISSTFEPTIVLNRAEFVEVINKDHPMYWKGKSQASGLVGYFPSENVKLYSSQSVSSPVVVPSPTLRQPSNGSQLLYNYPWYVGAMDRNGGRMMLEPATVPDGCYLVRESKRGPGQFSIDVKFNFMVKHIKVVYSEGSGYCLAPSKTFNSIVELVMHYQRSTLGQVFRDLQTKLTVPYRCLPGS